MSNKTKSKDKNSFLNTNYRQKNHQSKFNSIGKIISMNYPLMSNDKAKKAFSKNKNNIDKNENLVAQNHIKSRSPNSNDVNQDNQNLPQGYNSKSENDLCSNFSERDLYGTIQNFSKGSSPKKFTNNINKVNVIFNETNQVSSLHNGDVVYKNFFSNNNKFQNTNYPNKISNQTHGVFFFAFAG